MTKHSVIMLANPQMLVESDSQGGFVPTANSCTGFPFQFLARGGNGPPPEGGGHKGRDSVSQGGGMARDAVATYYSNIYQLDSSINISYCDKRLVLSCRNHNLI